MNKHITALAVVGATLVAMPAFAQTAAPAAATPTPLRHGTPVPGLCTFSGEAAVTGSQVGKFVGQRLRELEAPIEADLNSQAQAFEQSVQTYSTQQATLTPEAREQQATALNQRRAQLQQLAQIRAREGQLTQQKAIERINTEMTPLVSQAYQVHNCSVLLDANVVMAIAPQSDITQDVVRALDAKITQFQFERERIDAAAAGAAPAAAAPAAAAPAVRR
jgi:outer membrane protein